MPADSLFGHLALRFGAHPENLATEALAYTLGCAPTARRALRDLASGLDGVNVVLPEELTFKTQVWTKDQAIPDLVGSDAAGAKHLIIEAKFWAGLTDRQPVDYLAHLPDSGGLLLFVAPSARLPALWAELLRRCKARGLVPLQPPTEGRYVTTFAGGRALGLTSWRAVIDALTNRLAAAGELRGVAELEQLRGLCDRMDEDAFLPITSEELATPSPRRVLQFIGLVDVLATRSTQTWCNTRGLRTGCSPGIYGRYLRLNRSGAPIFLHVDLRKWADLRMTPLWLRAWDPGWQPAVQARAALGALEREDPPRLLTEPVSASPVTIPLYPPLCVERDEVVDSLFHQLKEVYAVLDTLAPAKPKAASAPPPDGLEEAAPGLESAA